MIKLLIPQLAICLHSILFAGSYTFAFQGPLRFPPRPKPETRVIPAFPPIARAACIEGTVSVVVDVNSTGRVTNADVLYGHPLLWQTAVEAARNWAYNPESLDVGTRREALRFSFRILPFEVSEKEIKPIWISETEVEIRSYPSEPSCTHCTEKRRRQLRRGGCPKT